MIAKINPAVVVVVAILGVGYAAIGDVDPVSRWKFNEGIGKIAADSMGAGNTGTLTNLDTNACWVEGVVGKAMKFNGTNGCVSCPNSSSLNLTNEISVEVWLKPDVRGNYHTIVTKGSYAYSLYTIGGTGAGTGAYGRIYWQVGNPTNGYNVCHIVQKPLYSNHWYHVVSTYRPGLSRIYIDGQLQPDGVVTCAAGGIRTNDSALTIGSRASYTYNEVIDDMRIYDRALDAEEIQNHYQAELGNSVRGWWSFNERGGSILLDLSGESNVGTLTNMDTNICWVTGYAGKAMIFNGSNGCVSCPNSSSLNLTNEISVEVWLKPDVRGNYHTIVTKGSYAYSLYTIGGTGAGTGAYGRIYWQVGNPTNGYNVCHIVQKPLYSNHWYHVVSTYRPGLSRIYIDGQLQPDGVVTCAAAGIRTNDSALTIGASAGYTYNEAIDDMRIYDRALTEMEVYNRYAFRASGHWRFDEGYGARVFDISGAGAHGVLSNMDSAACWAPGAKGMALRFDGVDDEVFCPNDGRLAAGKEICVEAWVKPDIGAGFHAIACQGTERSYFLGTYEGKSYFAAGKADGSDWNAIAEGATVMDSSRWYHLAGVYRAGQASVYVNAMLDGVGAGAVETIYATDASLTIGAAGCSCHFNGTIDDLRVYKHALPVNDIYRNYFMGGLCGYWRCDDRSGSAVADSSGMGNCGALVDGDATAEWGDGTIGGGLTLDGTNDYVDCGNNVSLTATNEICVSAWVKPDTRDGYHVIAARYACTYFLAVCSRRPYFAIGNADHGGWNVSLLGTNALDSSRWVHLAGTYKDGIGRLYVNGGLDACATGTAQAIGSYYNLSLGSYYNSTYLFQGTLDEIRVYNRALAADELYNQCQSEGGAFGFGCEGNPTGNPIGGGAGYGDMINPDTATYFVSTTNTLIAALAAAVSGDVIYVDDTAQIDLSEYLSAYTAIRIPGGVTLASGRGVNGSSGALLYSTVYDASLFRVNGDNVRVTGLRLQGPQPTTSDLDASVAIFSAYRANLEVDNCEISACGWSGIALYYTPSAYIHHNYIHHCQRTGYGYGVSLVYGPVDCVIEANQFDYMRHSIASSGYSNQNYEACFNLVLEHATSHSFDVHGGLDRGDGTTIAGGVMLIHHNTFKPEGIAGVTIRGNPYAGCWVYNNWFNNLSYSKPIRQCYAPAYSNMAGYVNIFTTNRVWEVETSVENIWWD